MITIKDVINDDTLLIKDVINDDGSDDDIMKMMIMQIMMKMI